MDGELTWTERYYTGEVPRLRDVVRLGGNPAAKEWTVDVLCEDRETMNISRGLFRRYGMYVSRFALVRRDVR